MKVRIPRSNRKLRSAAGINLVEGAAAIAVVLPMSLIMIAIIVEVTSFLLIKNILDEAARLGARGCAMAYHWPAYGVAQTPTGTLYSADAQGDTVDPPSTSGSASTSSPSVVGTSSGIALSSGQPQTANDAWARIRIGNVITSNTQFTAVYTPASVNNTSNPENLVGHVTVTVKSPPGVFANPDPLNIKVLLPNFTISSSSTYCL